MIIFRGISMVFILGATYIGSKAQPSVVPKSVIAQVETVARFNCTATGDQPVYWTTKPYESPFTNDIYIGEKFLLDEYGSSGRFSVEVNSTTRRYDLVIKDIKHSDGGVYSCIGERGLGGKTDAELVVWDTSTCKDDHRQDSYMGDNVFGLDQDTITFTCIMRYIGNIRPRLVWSAGGRKWNGTHGTDSGIASSSLILVATSKLDGAKVTVEAVIGSKSSEDTRTQVLWTSDIIRVEYAIFQMESVDECPSLNITLKCNPPCSYKLETGDDTQRCVVSYSTGTSTRWFYIYPRSAAQISEPVVVDSSNSIIQAVFITAASTAVIIVIAILGYHIMCSRRKTKKSNAEKRLMRINQDPPRTSLNHDGSENNND